MSGPRPIDLVRGDGVGGTVQPPLCSVGHRVTPSPPSRHRRVWGDTPSGAERFRRTFRPLDLRRRDVTRGVCGHGPNVRRQDRTEDGDGVDT